MKDYSAIVAAVVAFIVTVAIGYVLIPYLRKLKFGQTILDIGPKWHKEKQGTPTMGGIMMIIGLIVAVACGICFSLFTGSHVMIQLGTSRCLITFVAGILLALFMGAIGFADDYIKVVKKRNLGLTAKQKTFLQLLISAVYLLVLRLGGMTSTNIPFIGDIDITKGFGLLFWPIAIMFIYGFTNAVNLTDGIDGLASSVTLVVSCAFMMASGFIFNYTMPMNMLSAALAGTCAGFICWNAKPAKVFMGDTGSMFLGGMVVAISFGIGRPIVLLFAGCMYLFEALSDIIQVIYYKKTKKRFFKMAPLHHHFEMCGWSEQKIVFVFSVITFIGCVIGVLPIILDSLRG